MAWFLGHEHLKVSLLFSLLFFLGEGGD
jgi:hypothetical protein